MSFRLKPAGVVREAIGEGSLDLFEACSRSAAVANGPLKFTLTSPYMLARTLLDNHYNSLD
jgi:5-methyltetrahydropteroyltriglutamate--homocysteine methyltransferase